MRNHEGARMRLGPKHLCWCAARTCFLWESLLAQIKFCRSRFGFELLKEVGREGGAACPQAADVRPNSLQRVGDNAFHLSVTFEMATTKFNLL